MVHGPGYQDSVTYGERTPINFQARIDLVNFGLIMTKRTGEPMELTIDGDTTQTKSAIEEMIGLLRGVIGEGYEDDGFVSHGSTVD